MCMELYISKYVCIHVAMYACMYVLTYAYMYVLVCACVRYLFHTGSSLSE